jgi:hypothetical protein
MNKPCVPKSKTLNILFGMFVFAASSSFTYAAEEKLDEGDLTHDGLTVTESSRRTTIQVRKGVDWAPYDKFIILEPYVAFKEDWQKDYNKDRRGVSGRVTDKDVARIKQGMADLLEEAFIETFIEEGGFKQVTELQANTLLLRPAIINLDAYAPDIPTAGRSKTYTRSAGDATLYLEIFDAVSGAILARWVDYEEAPDYGYARWATRGTNKADAKAIIRRWTKRLEKGFENVREGKTLK